MNATDKDLSYIRFIPCELVPQLNGSVCFSLVCGF